MITDIELLNHIHQNADMGCDSIKNIINLSNDSDFIDILNSQLRECQDTKNITERMLKDRQIQPKDADSVIKAMAHISSTVKTIGDHSSSKLTEIMIEGYNMGIINLSKEINDYNGNDREILSLAKSQLKTEQHNIDKLKKFLHS